MSRPDARLEALDAAAVALLEPVVIGDADWRRALDDALAAFGTASTQAGFDALAELAARLRRRAAAAGGDAPAAGRAPVDGDALADGDALVAGDALADDEALRATVGNWAADLLDLCAGRLESGQALALAGDDPALAGRVAEAARRLAALRGGEGGEGGQGGARGSAAQATTGTPTVVARDELDILAEESLALRDELASADDPQTRLAAFADGLLRIADAAGLLGLDATSTLIAARGEQLQQAADPLGRPPFAPPAAEALESLAGDLPEALAELFRKGAAAPQALRLLADPRWPAPLESSAIEAVAAEFGGLRQVASRQVQAAEPTLDERDLSLAIPPDADPSVVDSLLHELPALSAQLGERIAAFEAGDPEALVAAQRLAHTLKGSANTVGVRGIAAITHRLEDLLQLLSARREALPADLHALLGDAADCVAEMCEAVAGFGPAPSAAAAVHGRIVDWIGRLLGSEAEPAPATGGVAGPATQARPEAVMEAPREAPEAGQPAEPASPRGTEPEIRVPASLVARLLSLVDEAAILVAHAREQTVELERSRGTLRLGGDQLQDLASELERLVDIRGLALSEHRSRQNLDPLELDEYNDLHTVSRRIAESGADGKLVEQQLGANLGALRDSLARLERLQAELRDCALQTRMAAFGSIASRLHRTVRQAARMAGREAELRIEGEDTLIEAGMLSTLVDALAHLLRNAVDHGIEAPERRRAAGKPAAGEIRLTVRRDGASLQLVCEDDGQGLDLGAIRERALASGLLAADSPADPGALRALIMAAGFSTRERASQLSGRGIGLDVVRQSIEGLRGRIAIDSAPGQGTRFTLTVPLGLASLPVMMLRAPGRPLAIALSVRGIDRIVPAPAGAGDSIRVDGARWRASPIEAVLGLPEDAFAGDDAPVADAAAAPRSALLMRLPDGRRAALLVPEPEAPRSVVVRPMPAHLPRVPGIDGVAVLGDGAVAPVLDPIALLAAHADGSLRARAAAPVSRAPASRTAPLCLVVDDSVSVRRTTEIFVRDLGFEVDGAADGIEALERVRRRVPDLALVDMEMPRMNGLEFVRALRSDPRSENVAVIMITSRYSERHKTLALEAGVDVFLTKPYTEDALATQILACLERRPAHAPPAAPVPGRT
ncbi:hybrid sensor histidine kinase/response regulator [Zeimonas arvi]|uniref:Chemotaxis protein CheA n=1 Tax=Zeimonas arvi TaxID=2498847 RepID=A0A5C8NK69_9BURK|nr:hybrid sensor histidine kinase/response regulator [Zeimonas arvi]TXL61668.1 response regulator [Zeimonas arvi]